MTTMNEERAGFEAWLGVKPCGAAHDLAYEAFKAGAAWQRAQGAVPEPVRDALARRCLWLAFCWNDHNFGPAHEEARKEALKHGIDSFDAANEWLAAAPAHPAERQEQGEVQRLRDVLDEYERQTKALPCQHEIPERGCSTYNWRMSVIRDLRAALAASIGQEVG